MNINAPHYLLFSQTQTVAGGCGDEESSAERPGDASPLGGSWRFVLQMEDGSTALEATDEEPELPGDRLELLAIVRGLEALDQPSRVTLYTDSRYVSRGLRFGLENWRESDWHWERYGQMLPVKNSDLWQRIDRAMRYHTVECRATRCDSNDDLNAPWPFAPDLSADETPDFREVVPETPPRHLRVRERKVRIDAGHLAARGKSSARLAGKSRSRPPSLWNSLLSAATSTLGRLLGSKTARHD